MKQFVVVLMMLSMSSVALAEPVTVIVASVPSPSVTVMVARSRPSTDLGELQQSFTREIVRDATSHETRR